MVERFDDVTNRMCRVSVVQRHVVVVTSIRTCFDREVVEYICAETIAAMSLPRERRGDRLAPKDVVGSCIVERVESLFLYIKSAQRNTKISPPSLTTPVQ